MEHLDAWKSGIWKKELEKQLEEDRVKMVNAGKLEDLVIILNEEGEAYYPDFTRPCIRHSSYSGWDHTSWGRSCRSEFHWTSLC